MYIVHLFSDAHIGAFSLNTGFFLLPVLLLLFRRNARAKTTGLFFVCLWLATFIIVTVMRRPAFERNFIGHYSLTVAALLLLIWQALSTLATSNAVRNIALTIFGVITLLFAVHFASANGNMLKDVAYEYNVNESYDALDKGLRQIPAGSTLSCSDEAFYCGYIASKNGCKVSSCPTGNEVFFIKKEIENLPLLLQDYVKVGQVNEYEIFRRNE